MPCDTYRGGTDSFGGGPQQLVPWQRLDRIDPWRRPRQSVLLGTSGAVAPPREVALATGRVVNDAGKGRRKLAWALEEGALKE